jgi:hypothetical protein
MESLLPVLRAAFEASVVINAAVLLVLLVGLGLAIAQAAALRPVRDWVDQASRGFSVKEPPALIAPLARVLAGKERDGFVVSLSAMGALLDVVRGRLDEGRYAAGQVLAALAFLR